MIRMRNIIGNLCVVLGAAILLSSSISVACTSDSQCGHGSKCVQLWRGLAQQGSCVVQYDTPADYAPEEWPTKKSILEMTKKPCRWDDECGSGYFCYKSPEDGSGKCAKR